MQDVPTFFGSLGFTISQLLDFRKFKNNTPFQTPMLFQFLDFKIKNNTPFQTPMFSYAFVSRKVNKALGDEAHAANTHPTVYRASLDDDVSIPSHGAHEAQTLGDAFFLACHRRDAATPPPSLPRETAQEQQGPAPAAQGTFGESGDVWREGGRWARAEVLISRLLDD